MNNKVYLLLPFLILFGIGCATTPKWVQQAQLLKGQEGKYTKEQALLDYGAPTSCEKSDKIEVCKWIMGSHASGNQGGANIRLNYVMIWFDDLGKMKKYDFSNTQGI